MAGWGDFLTILGPILMVIGMLYIRRGGKKMVAKAYQLMKDVAKEDGNEIIYGPELVEYIAERQGYRNVKVAAFVGLSTQGVVYKTEKMPATELLPFSSVNVLDQVQSTAHVGIPGNMVNLVVQAGDAIHIFKINAANLWRNKITELQTTGSISDAAKVGQA